MRRLSLIISFIFILVDANWSFAQNSFNNEQLLDELRVAVSNGEKRALRDLGTLLIKKEVKEKAQLILKNYSLFTKDEIDFSENISRKDFLDFYYKNEEEIHFSTYYGAFFLNPVEGREVEFNIKEVDTNQSEDHGNILRLAIQQIHKNLSQHNLKVIPELVKEIGDLKIKEGYDFLIGLLKNDEIIQASKSKKEEIFVSICLELGNFSNLRSAKSILSLVKKEELDPKIASSILAKVTNVNVIDDNRFSELYDRYVFLIDSLASLEAVRSYGYEKIFKFKLNFFHEPVDYYGTILSKATNFPWIEHNALQDLSLTRNTRALYYISAKMYKNRLNENVVAQNQLYLDRIQKLTGIYVGVKNELQEMIFLEEPSSDKILKLNYLCYWATHFDDYIWDENFMLFTNKEEAKKKAQNYERLFRRLNSKNDTIAQASFMQLTEGEPASILSLTKKYRQLLRTYNPSLPSFNHQYLEQLVQLTDYCKKNKIKYKPSTDLATLFEQLNSAKSESQRYKIENKIISDISLNEITALEYWCCLQEKNQALTFSVGRILDHFYSNHWHQIISNEQQLRLYLKKSYLFEGIGVIGICNEYLNKFDIDGQNLRTDLKSLMEAESDKGIKNQIFRIIEEPLSEKGYTINDFLEQPTSFNTRELKLLASPRLEEYKNIVQKIKEEEDPSAIKKLFAYLRLHPSLEFVPVLFELIDNEKVISTRRGIDLNIADFTIPVLQKTFNFSFPKQKNEKPVNTEKWRQLWKKDGANYNNWLKQFFDEKLIAFQKDSVLSIEDVNAITQSPFYLPKYKTICLEALKKVKPIKNIRKLIIQPKLSAIQDLEYFESLNFSYKELDDIPKLFDIDDPEKMFHFLFIKSINFDLSDRGSFYNTIFGTKWFSEYVRSGKVSGDGVRNMKGILFEYLNESEILTEFEEQLIYLNIAKLRNIGKTLKEKLETSIELKVDDIIKNKIQQSILSTITYEQIGTVMRNFDLLIAKEEEYSCQFLQTDFGIPIFDLGFEERTELIEKHENLSEYEFYIFYLNRFGLDFFTKKGKLDFEKIYTILQYDIVSPFIGESGGKKDIYVYGIIKLLEIHFDTRLGFHEKLNESQSFYTFTSMQRAKAWRKFFIENQLINKDKPKELQKAPPFAHKNY